MPKKRKAVEEEVEEGAPGWMVTYGDMMSLLLTFFVLIVSFSSIQEAKFNKAMGSLKAALGVMKGSTGANQQIQYFRSTEQTSKDELIEQVLNMKAKLAEKDLQEQVKVTLTEKGAHIIIQDPLLFDTGSDQLKTQVVPALDIVADLIREAADTEVLVEGHTDNVPIHNERFPSNWELSAARALTVVKYLAFHGNLEPARFAATGYGEYRPVKPNDSSENRTKNRRVEIYVNTREGDFTAAIPEKPSEN